MDGESAVFIDLTDPLYARYNPGRAVRGFVLVGTPLLASKSTQHAGVFWIIPSILLCEVSEKTKYTISVLQYVRMEQVRNCY